MAHNAAPPAIFEQTACLIIFLRAVMLGIWLLRQGYDNLICTCGPSSQEVPLLVQSGKSYQGWI